MANFYFAGVARSKSVRPIDDGVGPQIDEFFTLAIGGMCTLLNNSGTVLYPGDMLEWCFYNQKAYTSAGSKGAARGNARPAADHGQDRDGRERARHRPRGTHKTH